MADYETLNYANRFPKDCAGCDSCGPMLNEFGYCAHCWSGLSEKRREAMGVKVVPQFRYVPTPRLRTVCVVAWVGGLAGATVAMLVFRWLHL